MSIDITELDASLTLRNLSKEEKQAVVRLMELSIEETKADMQARRKALETENSVMYAAILEASNLGTNSAALRCKVELQRIARNEAK